MEWNDEESIMLDRALTGTEQMIMRRLDTMEKHILIFITEREKYLSDEIITEIQNSYEDIKNETIGGFINLMTGSEDPIRDIEQLKNKYEQLRDKYHKRLAIGMSVAFFLSISSIIVTLTSLMGLIYTTKNYKLTKKIKKKK